MTDSGLLHGAVLFTKEPRDASIYYEWLLGLSSGERPGAGLADIGVHRVVAPAKTEESARGWMPVFTVESVDDAKARTGNLDVTFRQGQIPETDITVAINSAGIWTGLMDVQPTILPSTQHMNCDYSALDVSVATNTLRTLLGASSLEIMDDPYAMNLLYVDNQISTGILQMTGIEVLSTRPYWVTYFEVDDIQRTTIKAMESGSRIVIPPSKSPFNHYAIFQDPWGNIFGLSELDDKPSESQVNVKLENGSVMVLGELVQLRP